MKTKFLLAPALLGSALALGACAQNYAAEGALAGAAIGGVVGATSEADFARSAAIGAAAGAAAGALVRKDGRCYRVDQYGRERRVSCPR
jgi:osmotically inducible lipoprotein OsmB